MPRLLLLLGLLAAARGLAPQSSTRRVVVERREVLGGALAVAGGLAWPARARAFEGTPKEQLKASIASLQNLETEFEKYSSKGGDEVRRVLGTVGIESPCFQLEKALKKLALDAEDPEAYSEAVEQLMLAISRADGMAYSANFAGGSGKPLPPAVYLEKSRKEVVLVNAQMKDLLAALGPL